jgi:hypothetical protein
LHSHLESHREGKSRVQFPTGEEYQFFPVFHLDSMASPLLSYKLWTEKRVMVLKVMNEQVIWEYPSQKMHQ